MRYNNIYFLHLPCRNDVCVVDLRHMMHILVVMSDESPINLQSGMLTILNNIRL